MNCIIIHGCPRNEKKAADPKARDHDKQWLSWTKNQLTQKNIPTKIPLMPEPWKPNYQKFKEEFEKLKITKDSVLIGHSCGCAFLVRWLGETNQKIKKLILVAPWKIPDGPSQEKIDFYTHPINKLIKNNVKEIIIFTSNNEEEDGKKSVEIFHKALGGKIIELKGRGHYLERDMGTTEFPELINTILN